VHLLPSRKALSLPDQETFEPLPSNTVEASASNTALHNWCIDPDVFVHIPLISVSATLFISPVRLRFSRAAH
jgi:hypothetical protein